jgi:formylglycine-generating enzyme required for sulfatase activity
MVKHTASYNMGIKVIAIALAGILALSACSTNLPTLPATVVVPSATTIPAATDTAAVITAPSATVAPSATEGPTATAGAPSATAPAGSITIKTQTSDKDGMVMVFVTAGDFKMGSDPAKDTNTAPEEQPQHTVTLKDYWIDQTDVTNAMFAAFIKATAYKTDAEKGGWG